MPLPHPQSSRSAFTLIELLCVIAIIAELSAILFPVFSRARGMARRASCQGNLRQIGIGLSQYTQDYDEYMPFRATFASTKQATLQNNLQPYVKSYQIFQCPANEFKDKLLNDDSSSQSHTSYAPLTRSISGSADNGGVFSKGDGGTFDRTPLSLAAFTYPSTTIALDGHVKALTPEETYTPVNMWHRGNIPFSAVVGIDPSGISDAAAIIQQSAAYYHNG